MNHVQQQILEAFAASGQNFECENLVTEGGHELSLLFFRHASLGIVWDGTVIYADPLMEYADYARLPKADLVLVTHEHYDHFDEKAIRVLLKPDTVIVGSREVSHLMSGVTPLSPGDGLRVSASVAVRAVAAYNTTPSHLQFHPKKRGDNGYVLTLDGTTIYIAGDTEVIPEMASLGKIDFAFLPVNQPYTMTPEQAAEATRIIRPEILYPYHTTDTDLSSFSAMLDDVPVSVRIYPME